jgi:hypothetical protein
MPRKKKPATPDAPAPWRVYKLRLPTDIAERIEQEAAAEGRPVNRIIMNTLAAAPVAKQADRFEDSIRQLETMIWRHSARITWLDLTRELLDSVDDVLNAEGAEIHAAVDKLRIIRRAIELTDKVQKRNSP